MGPVTILHADMDAFYASVEQHDRPELRGKPVIVGGLGNRGVVSTASYEARKFGVHSAMPTLQARQLCPQGIFVPGRMQRYVEIGQQVRQVFEEFTPEVEPLSLDEAFLDITGSLTLFGGARQIGVRLKARVLEVTGLAVSVGIGPTKMIAKIASGKCKPDGLLEVSPAEAEAFLRPLPVNQIWGAGPTTCAALERLGIRTVGDLADADPALLERSLGNHGPALRALARGDDARSVEADRQRKSYGEEQTFDRDLRDGIELRRIVAAQAEAIARRLRRDNCVARTVTLKVKLAQRIGPGKYPLLTRRTTLAAAVDDGAAIHRTAVALWNSIKNGLTIRLVGVAVSGIQETGGAQMPLFASPDVQRRTRLNRAVDALVDRFGSDAIQRADSVGVKQHAARSLGKGPR
ncbi:MAG: DNA polymerase IV [Deltaproteobacteria bacterium]|nr:DNA polymerase IV [Deltaproteobacteria bacterium]